MESRLETQQAGQVKMEGLMEALVLLLEEIEMQEEAAHSASHKVN
jgi:hypothetical protein